MRFWGFLPLVLANLSLAARYVIDSSCRSKNGFVDGIKIGVNEAIHLAENALDVLNNHADDRFVLQMAQHILGQADFDTKLSAAKETLSKVKGYEREPSEFLPFTEGWNSQRQNTDIEMYCDAERFHPIEGKTLFLRDTAMGKPIYIGNVKSLNNKCYRPDLAPGPEDKIKISTLISDAYDAKGHKIAQKADPDADIPKARFILEQPNIPCTMDLCTWFIKKWEGAGWPVINEKTIADWKTDAFTSTLFGEVTPVDGLKTLGVTLLHEFTHTVQGGKLRDVNAPHCYGWICVGRLGNERNSDSIAMLGMAMKLWTLGNYIEGDGSIHAIPA